MIFSKKANFVEETYMITYIDIHIHSIQFLRVQHIFEYSIYLYMYICIPVKGSLSIDIYINS